MPPKPEYLYDMSDRPSFLQTLGKSLRGDVHQDDLRLGMYATDASIYQIKPVALVYPKDANDVMEAVTIAREFNVPILARGGGTSLAGQTVAEAMVLDFTKYMHQILDYNPAEKWIRVQPGISRGELNAFLKKDTLEFAPDPATSTRAAIGGMIANNSSGTKSILYGKTSDHVLSLKMLLADGTIIETRHFPKAEITSLVPDTREEFIWKTVYETVQAHSEEIRTRYPKTMRRVGGYCLDELINDDPWNPGRIFLGSEGTLGIILEATLNLVPLPKYKSLAVIHFADRMEAIRPVGLMIEHKPAAVEILSKMLLDYSKKNLETQSMCGFIKGDPQAIQMVEFYGDTADEVIARPKEMIRVLKEAGYGYAHDIYPEGETYRNVWAIRERGLGLLLGEPSEEKGVEFIEDAAIPIPHLAEYIDRVLKVCEDLGVDVTYYAHASVGVIHVRPILNLRTQEGIDNLKQIAQEAFRLVVHYKGSWSSEHGDGIIRSGFLREFYGDTIYGLFQDIKQLFDPGGLLNPSKIIDPPPMDENLRYGVKYHDHPVETQYHYRDQVDFHTAVHQCSGLGACRKMSGGTMCPSYMVTRDETHTTRGRANALRLAMSGQLSDKGLSDPALLETLDLCVSCKACKAECPSSVDMARLKSEVLQMQYNTRGTTFRDRLIRDSAVMAQHMSGTFAPLVNAVQESVFFRSILEKTGRFSQKRMLPGYARQPFVTWYEKQYKAVDGPDVVLFADTYLNYHEPQIGRAAVSLINHLGYNVVLAHGCCQRPRISHGFLELAKKQGITVAQDLDKYIQQNIPVLVCEPSCASALTDDLPDLLDDAQLAERMHTHIVPLESWVSAQIQAQGRTDISVDTNKIILHGHCHQKALFGTKAIHHILTTAGAEVIEPDSGCCGMAGSFGYEKEHYDISEKMFERILGPALRAHPDSVIVASGFSCRHQIGYFAQRKAMHWIEKVRLRPRSR